MITKSHLKNKKRKNLKMKMRKRKVNMKVKKRAAQVGLRNQRTIIKRYKIYLKEHDQIQILQRKNQLNQIAILVNHSMPLAHFMKV